MSDKLNAERLRALDEANKTMLITTLRNWQREMERSCDALRKLGPHMEEAAMGNAHVAEALEEASDTLLAMAEERDRMREALEGARTHHEAEHKALSKQPPSNESHWRKMQHREQIDEITRALGGEVGDGRT